jgi:LacI family transcriptional regulator
MRPPLTSVAVPQAEIGAESARLLLSCSEQADRPARSVLLPLTLTVRGSTGPVS